MPGGWSAFWWNAIRYRTMETILIIKQTKNPFFSFSENLHWMTEKSGSRVGRCTRWFNNISHTWNRTNYTHSVDPSNEHALETPQLRHWFKSHVAAAAAAAANANEKKRMFIFWASSKSSGAQILESNEIEFSARVFVPNDIRCACLICLVTAALCCWHHLSYQLVARCRHVCALRAHRQKRWRSGAEEERKKTYARCNQFESSLFRSLWLFALMCIHRQTNTLTTYMRSSTTTYGEAIGSDGNSSNRTSSRRSLEQKVVITKPNIVWCVARAHAPRLEKSLYREARVYVCAYVMKRRGRKCCHHFVVCSFPFVVRERTLQQNQWITSLSLFFFFLPHFAPTFRFPRFHAIK